MTPARDCSSELLHVQKFHAPDSGLSESLQHLNIESNFNLMIVL